MKMTHDEYIYVVKPGNSYPQIASYQSEDEERNYEMVKLGKVKIEGIVRYVSSDLMTTWLESVKISVLKRKIGNADYPTTVGVETLTDKNGKYYLEYDGNENYEFFLKPEIDGYYYDNGYIFTDCEESNNFDPGYTIGFGFEMKKDSK